MNSAQHVLSSLLQNDRRLSGERCDLIHRKGVDFRKEEQAPVQRVQPRKDLMHYRTCTLGRCCPVRIADYLLDDSGGRVRLIAMLPGVPQFGEKKVTRASRIAIAMRSDRPSERFLDELLDSYVTARRQLRSSLHRIEVGQERLHTF